MSKKYFPQITIDNEIYYVKDEEAREKNTELLEYILNAYPVESSSGATSTTQNGANNIYPKTIEVTMLPIQDLNGYDSPWPDNGLNGGNIWDTYKYPLEQGAISSSTGNNSTSSSTRVRCAGGNSGEQKVPVIGSTTYTINAGGTAASCYIFEYDSNGAYQNISSDWQSLPYTFTVDSTTSFIRFTLRNSDSTAITPSDIGWVTIVEGSSAIPYSNICNISGRTGANIYHEIEYDSGASPFATFNWFNVTGTAYGAILSDNHNGTWTLTRDWEYAESNASGQMVFATSGTAVNPGANTTNRGYVYYNCGTATKPYPTSVGNGICNMLKVASISGTSKECFFPYQTSSGVGRLGFRIEWLPGWNTATSDLSASEHNKQLFKDWLATEHAKGNKLQVVWRLITPFTYTLPADSVKSFLADNVFWSDSGDSLVIWRCDPTLFINSKIALLTSS